MSKPGYLKSEKNLATNIGDTLQTIGQTGYNIFNTGAIQTGAGIVGKAVAGICCNGA